MNLNIHTMARTLASRCADACNVDRDDYWKQYGDECIEDVEAMVAACQQTGSTLQEDRAAAIAEMRFCLTPPPGEDVTQWLEQLYDRGYRLPRV